jgi:hypothetical protein
MLAMTLKCFQVFCKCFYPCQTHVASVLFRCCKSRSDIAHIAMRVRSEGGASGPHTRPSGVGNVRTAWATACVQETHARDGACWYEHGRRVQARVGEMECSQVSGY